MSRSSRQYHAHRTQPTSMARLRSQETTPTARVREPRLAGWRMRAPPRPPLEDSESDEIGEPRRQLSETENVSNDDVVPKLVVEPVDDAALTAVKQRHALLCVGFWSFVGDQCRSIAFAPPAELRARLELHSSSTGDPSCTGSHRAFREPSCHREDVWCSGRTRKGRIWRRNIISLRRAGAATN